MLTDIVVSLVLSLPLIGAYAIFAIGIVLIYRASHMLNLAHGAMAMLPAYLLYTIVQWGVPTAIAFPLALVCGAALGLGVEKVFVGRLRADGPTAQTVGTVAALGIIVAVAARIWGTSGLPAVTIFPEGRVSIGASSIQYGELGLFAVMLVVAAALYLLVQRTDLGLMMRGTAESRLAASLMGVNPDGITSLTWAMGGALAALAGVLLAAVTSLHPYTLALQVLPAFIAALIGGLGSLPGALVGAGIVGTVQGLVPLLGAIGDLQGAPQLLLSVLAVVVMATRGKSLAGADDGAEARALGGGGGGMPRARRRRSRVRLVVGIVALVAFPYLPGMPSSIVGTANQAAIYAIIGVSIVLLTGWVGQISLGHAALVGVGAYLTGHIVEGAGIVFPLSLPIAAVLSGGVAAMLGAVAVRVRGLYLAVATLVFSWMASEFLFRQDWFTQHGEIGERAIGEKGQLPFFDFSDRRTFFLVALAALGLVAFGAANVRDSKTGRAFFALRGSEMAAASLGIDVVRYKFLAFVTSGAIAGIAGNLIMTEARVVTPDQFSFNRSLFYVAIAVVGGLVSLPGAVASGIVFAALSEVFYRVEVLGAFLEIVSSLLLAVVLIAYRGGLASFPDRARRIVELLRPRIEPVVAPLVARIPERWRHRPEAERAWSVDLSGVGERIRDRRHQVATATRRLRARLPIAQLQPPPELAPEAPLDFKAAVRATTPAVNGHSAEEAHPEPVVDHQAELAALRARLSEVRPLGDRSERRPLIEADHVTVRFGGLTAVDDASLQVCEGEIVGLIGPNGAGKTTLFNAVAGYNTPAAGIIRLYGQDVTNLPVHRRARVGVARTFQLIQLFRQLSVYENLLVATHVHNPTGFGSHLVVSGRAIEQEEAAVDRVNEILDLLDLTDIAYRPTGDLPFGVLRMVEVARALVTGFRVIMLDEPASGLDNTETDRLIEVLRFVRGLGVTLLLIEHDVRMVTGVSDYMYVLEQGRIIAEGVPEDIQRNPAVIAAYLGEPADASEKEMVG
ncbi:MAG TPA: branched-chain amino acid ABC transporter permease/ATP-binding protein [Acidimicrobiales bacterium]|nr:branched-chain amino acid ABC transporter permease/ATP-binding protein [Acidimicrobiales bacterium]